MKVSRTYDIEMIKELITRDEIWSTIAEDGQVKENYSPKVEAECWLEVTVDDKVIALYNIHTKNCITVEFHAHVLPKYRKEYSRPSFVAAFRWIYENAPVYQKVVGQIPFCCENVKRFCENIGFKHEGVNRLSYLKNGEILDQWIMGITRDEIKEVIA